MKDPKTLIDMKKHMLWTKRAEKAVRDDISKRFPGREEEVWEKTALQYAEYVKDVPFLGGKKNRQASGFYDSVLGFAYYEAAPEKLTGEELEKVVNDIYLPVYERVEGKVDANRPFFRRIMQFAFRTVEKGVKSHEAEWPGNYHMEVLPYDKEHGIEYRFLTCPLADFAKAHGLTHLMPYFCNADYPMLKQMGAGLIRQYTCSNGPYCDYWIVGDRSRHLEEHPVYRDEEGYLRNDR